MTDTHKEFPTYLCLLAKSRANKEVKLVTRTNPNNIDCVMSRVFHKSLIVGTHALIEKLQMFSYSRVELTVCEYLQFAASIASTEVSMKTNAQLRPSSNNNYFEQNLEVFICFYSMYDSQTIIKRNIRVEQSWRLEASHVSIRNRLLN